MQTQKYLREVIDLPGVDEASGPYFNWLAQFRRMFMDNGMFESEKLEDALQVYESLMFSRRCQVGGAHSIFTIY